MIVPEDLKVCKLNPQMYLTRYVERVPSRIQTNVQENLLIIVMTGKKKLICGDYSTVISKGEFGFFRKGNYIMNQILAGDIFESLLVFVSDEYMIEIMDLIKTRFVYAKLSSDIPYVKGYIEKTMQQEINQILRLLQEDKQDYTDILKLKVKELLLYLINGTSSEHILNFIYSCNHKIDTLQQYMEQNYDQNQSIASIANVLNMSTSTFKRKFIKMYGLTPGKWLNSRRLQKAAHLLRTTDYLITDICFLCGFESVSTFNVQFKKNYGMTPGQYSRIKI